MSSETTKDDDEQPGELAPLSTSIVQIKIGNREYPMVRSTRCGVCMHPGRFAIEEKLMLNYGYPAIIRFISQQEVRKDDGSSEIWPALTTIQLRHHRDSGHIPLNSEMVQELAKRRAEAQGVDLENHTGQFVDHVVAQKIVLQHSVEALIKGEIKPDVKDLLAASKLLGDLEAATHQNENVEQYQELMIMMLRTLQTMLDETTFKSFLTKISGHPTFKAIQQKRTIEG